MAPSDDTGMPGNALLPLYIGITGHRDVRDEDCIELERLVGNYFTTRQKSHPHTPIVLLTPLAEGADRIGARAAIERGIDFIAVIPMPPESYRKTFEKPGSEAEFDELIKRASAVIQIPLPEGSSAEDADQNQQLREEQYEQTGLFISRYCHTLIALWDGLETGKRGGTSHVVKTKRSGIPGRTGKEESRFRHLQTGPILHIVTPRESGPGPSDPLTVRVEYPVQYGYDEVSSISHERRILGLIEGLNRDIIALGPFLKNAIEHRTDQAVTGNCSIWQTGKLLTIKQKHELYSALADHFQKRRFFALRFLLSLVVIAFISLEVYVEFIGKPFILLLYPLIIGLGAFWYYWSKKLQFELKHEDYRAISETLRIQCILTGAGIEDQVSDHYLIRHRGDLEWILYAIRASELDELASPTAHTGSESNYETDRLLKIKDTWIGSQLAYFKSKGIHNDSLHRKWINISNWFFFTAIGSALALFLLSYLPEPHAASETSLPEWLHPLLISFIHIFLVLAAAARGYSQQMVFNEQSRNYQQMAQLFHLAKRKFEKAMDSGHLAEAREIIRELALEALAENGDWLLLHRSRPLEMPKG